MFPDERHVKIVRRIDEMEAETYGLYRRLERLRLDLQREWRVLPSGQRWTEEGLLPHGGTRKTQKRRQARMARQEDQS